MRASAAIAAAASPVARSSTFQEEGSQTTNKRLSASTGNTRLLSSTSKSCPSAASFCVPSCALRLKKLRTNMNIDCSQLQCSSGAEASQFLTSLVVLRVIGSGRHGVVLECSMQGSNNSFALKLEPMFKHATINNTTHLLDERDHKNTTVREIMTMALINSTGVWETADLGRPFSEMTLHVAHAVGWGTLRMTPYNLLKGIQGVGNMNPSVRSFLSESRTWSYMAMELASGCSYANLVGYIERIAKRPAALERFIACLCAQANGQLSIMSALHRAKHNDLHPKNLCWMYEEGRAKSIYYELPGGTRLIVPLSDTTPLGPITGTPSEHGAMIFQLIDWGLASAETPYSDEVEGTIQLSYGPTTSAGGEYEDSQFYHRFDSAQLLRIIRDIVRPEALTDKVRKIIEYTEIHECRDALACISSRYPSTQIACNTVNVEPSTTPISPGVDFYTNLFKLSLFDAYRLDVSAPAVQPSPMLIPVRYAHPFSIGPLQHTAVDNDTLRVQPQQVGKIGQRYSAHIAASTV